MNLLEENIEEVEQKITCILNTKKIGKILIGVQNKKLYGTQIDKDSILCLYKKLN
jgi:hypothetical protein